ncbi:molybdenum cofactor guanylyltransferase [Pirellulaceae bacterium SH467]|jgi:molybdopterin-guanine dinucleotide biosynthesis protein A
MNAYILAGGNSTRFGQCKARVEIDGTACLVRLCSQLRQSGLTPWVVSKRREDFSNLFCAKDSLPLAGMLADWDGYEGPLAGIVAALEHCKSDEHTKCWILTCDLIQWEPVWNELALAIPDAIMLDSLAVLLMAPVDPLGPSAPSLQPFPGLYDIRSSSFLREPAVVAKQSVFSWISYFESHVRQVSVPKQQAPRTFNTHDELRDGLSEYRGRERE